MNFISQIFNWRMLCTFFLGFSSGIPLLLVGSTMKLWLKRENVDLTQIGLFAWVGFPYAFKFLWSPLMDRFTFPFLGRRRGWILICQIALSLLLCLFAFLKPSTELWTVAALALCISFASASQDIAIDAYRREILSESELGLGSSFAISGYRVGMLLAGAGALLLADSYSWKVAYLAMAASVFLCCLFTILAPRPQVQAPPPATLARAFWEPLIEYFTRPGAVTILVFILLYKMGDSMASDMFPPFYDDMKFSLSEIAYVSKIFGFWATIVGGIIGGVTLLKIGLHRGLWFFGILQAISTALFAVLAHVGHSVPLLAGVIAFENVSSGMGSAAYVGFMASLCNYRFTATQYALLTSLMVVPRVFLGGGSGFLAKHMGWENYFIFCAVIAIPGLLMLKAVVPMANAQIKQNQ